jgi:c-di-GMP-binding flagellar brake protein YcgR
MSVASSRPASAGGPGEHPRTGMPVWLEDLPGGPWRTTVARAGHEGALVEAPRRGGAPVLLTSGAACVLAYMQREVPCEVPARVVGPAGEAQGLYELRYTGAPVRLQRRDSVRVPVQLLTVARLDDGDGGETALGALTENLSAGGALLRAPAGLAPGTEVTLGLSCGGATGELGVTARVLRADRVGDGPRPFRIAVTFVALPRPVEDRIVRFLFERQRELRRLERERL